MATLATPNIVQINYIKKKALHEDKLSNIYVHFFGVPAANSFFFFFFVQERFVLHIKSSLTPEAVAMKSLPGGGNKIENGH